MKKIEIFDGSSSGNTQTIAEQIAKSLNVNKKDVYAIEKISMDKISSYDSLLLGSSTWRLGISLIYFLEKRNILRLFGDKPLNQFTAEDDFILSDNA